MNYANLLFEVQEGLALLTINRPDKMNALNRETLVELKDCLDGIAGAGDLRALVIAGAGDRAFVAGADIEELAQLDPLGARELSRLGQETFLRIERLSIPVIAAVNGFALGGGCELAMACHLRLAASQAKFGQPEVNLGLIPGYGGTQRLARLVGRGRALEICLSGAMIDAEEAHRIGLVNRVLHCLKVDEQGKPLKDRRHKPVFDREAFLAAAVALAREIMCRAPLALGWCIEAVDRGLELSQDAGLKLEQDLFGYCFSTGDMREGTQAFLEKRKPEFKGR